MSCLNLKFSQWNECDIISHCSSQIKLTDEQWKVDIYAFILEWYEEGIFVQAKTSGSTGAPKPIQLEKVRMMESARMTGEFFKFKKDDTALLCLSPQFIAGKMMIVRAIVWQLNLICVNPNGYPLKELEGSINFAAMIPLQVNNSLHNKEQLALVKSILIGGGVIDRNLSEKLQSISTNCFGSFGMTETLSHIAIRSLNGIHKSNVYKALQGIRLSVDSRNCLKIESYKLLKKELITNDIVNLISESEFEWLGRFDHVVNSGGIKLFPEQIEEELSSFIKMPFFLIGISDEHLGEKMILLIESNECDREQKKKIQAEIDFYLEKFKRPREIFLVSKFERTATNKIQRKATLERLIEKNNII